MMHYRMPLIECILKIGPRYSIGKEYQVHLILILEKVQGCHFRCIVSTCMVYLKELISSYFNQLTIPNHIDFIIQIYSNIDPIVHKIYMVPFHTSQHILINLILLLYGLIQLRLLQIYMLILINLKRKINLQRKDQYLG